MLGSVLLSHNFYVLGFKSKGSVIVENHGTFDYEYDIVDGNSNGVSLYGFSEHEAEKMFRCKHDCPYPDYEKFYNYYGQLDYGDLWIQAAFGGRSTNFGDTKFDRGNVDFSLLSWTARAGEYEFERLLFVVTSQINQYLLFHGATDSTDSFQFFWLEAIQRATVYLNVFIQVYRTMQEFAIEHCRAGVPTEVGHWNDPVTNWDNAVAIYTGSLEGTEGTGNGHLLYTLADETCAAFKTCGEKRKSTSGTSSVNLEIFSHFQDGQGFLESGECEFAQGKKDRIIQLMTVPLIQGTIRSAYILENESVDDDQQKGAAIAFAAAILPDVHFCSPDDAMVIYDQLRISRTDKVKFLDVKLAFERNYECLGVTCADIGGYYDSKKGRYFKNAEPCGSRKNRGGGGRSTNRNGSKLASSFWRVAGMLGVLVVVGAAFHSRERILDIVANSRGIARIIDRVGGNNEYELGDSSRYSRLVPETDYQNLSDSGRYSQNLGDSGRFSQSLGGAAGGGMM